MFTPREEEAFRKVLKRIVNTSTILTEYLLLGEPDYPAALAALAFVLEGIEGMGDLMFHAIGEPDQFLGSERFRDEWEKRYCSIHKEK